MEQQPTLAERARRTLSAGDASVNNLRHVIDVLRRRKLLLVLTVLLVGLLGYCYYVRQAPVYEGWASVLVHRTGDVLAGKGVDVPSTQQNYLPTHIQLIQSPGVLKIALQDLETSVPAGTVLPTVDQLALGLKATSRKDTEIIEIRFQSRNREIIAPVLQAVVRSYQEFVNETHRSTSREMLEILTQQRVTLERELQSKEKELLAMQQQEGMLSAPPTKTVSPESTSLGQALTQARIRRLEIQQKLQALQTAIERGDMAESYLLPYLDRIGRDVVVRKLGLADSAVSPQAPDEAARRDQLKDLVELKRLKAIYGTNHPSLRAREQRLRAMEASLVRGRPDPNKRTQVEEELKALAVRLQEQDLADATKLEADLEQQFEAERLAAIETAARRAPLLVLESELGRLRAYYDTLVSRIREVNVGDDYAAISTRLIDPPRTPDFPIAPNPKRITLLSSVFGLMCGIGVCFVFDWWSPGYRGPEEFLRDFGIPVIAHIPKLSREHFGKPFEFITLLASGSREAEAFRSARTALMLCDSPPARFAVTSAAMGDGKSSIVANLGVAFAQSGLRTLLIDGDLRRPGLSRQFALHGTPGLADLLGQNVLNPDDLWAAVAATSLERLHVLPAGIIPPDPAERLAGDNFKQILAWAERHYDRIICDAPPVLALSDAAIISRLMNGTLFVVHGQKSTQQSTSRACDSLARMNCPILGVVVNSVTDEAGQQYSYNYQYSDQGDKAAPVKDS